MEESPFRVHHRILLVHQLHTHAMMVLDLVEEIPPELVEEMVPVQMVFGMVWSQLVKVNNKQSMSLQLTVKVCFLLQQSPALVWPVQQML